MKIEYAFLRKRDNELYKWIIVSKKIRQDFLRAVTEIIRSRMTSAGCATINDMGHSISGHLFLDKRSKKSHDV